MKIKIITCHEVYNYGASLQEYALINYLSSLGHDVVSIKYKPSYLDTNFSFFAIDNDNQYNKPFIKYLYIIAKIPERIHNYIRKNEFDSFSKKYINSTAVEYKTNEELMNNTPTADAFICGSDQIWNSLFPNGKDPAFYLDFVPDEVLKISYAASFATETIEVNNKSFVKPKIARLDYVSVRETSGVEIVKGLGINNVVQVMDPVFLLDRKYWIDKFIKPISVKYILIYDFDSNPEIKKAALKIAKNNNWKIYTVNKKKDYEDKNFHKKGPAALLNLIYNAQLILSNSFHAVAFSLIFQKQFLVFNREENINTRMRDLLSLFELENNIASSGLDGSEINQVDYNALAVKMEEYINKSKLFLQNSLNRN